MFGASAVDIRPTSLPKGNILSDLKNAKDRAFIKFNTEFI